MSYTIALERINVWVPAGLIGEERYACDRARADCRPQYVFSIPGQVRWRLVLGHMAVCQSRSCRSLRREIHRAVRVKLRWLVQEQKRLGCQESQELLYQVKSTKLKNFTLKEIAKHLARCPLERCSQLRRALLLTVRERLSPNRQEIFQW